MADIQSALKKIGLAEKEILIYLSLLALGPSPIRKIAEDARINRGTTHEILRDLQRQGLISYFHKEKHQHFVIEDPKNLINFVSRKKQEIEEAKNDIEKIIPKLYPL